MYIYSIHFHEYTIPDRAFRTRIELTKKSAVYADLTKFIFDQNDLRIL